MKKLILSILVFVSTMFAINLVNANQLGFFYTEEQKIKSEKEAITQWLANKYSSWVNYEAAKQIVDSVYVNSLINDLNPVLVMALMEKESRFQPKARSSAGAVGLMQVMPRIHRKKFDGRNPYSRDANIEVGIEIFRECLTSRKGNVNKALNCYSGGAKYNDGVKKSHDEIKNYVVTYQFANEHPVYAGYKFHQPIVRWPLGSQQIKVASSSY